MPGDRRAAHWLVEDWTELRAQHLEFDESELVQVIEFLQKDILPMHIDCGISGNMCALT